MLLCLIMRMRSKGIQKPGDKAFPKSGVPQVVAQLIKHHNHRRGRRKGKIALAAGAGVAFCKRVERATRFVKTRAFARKRQPQQGGKGEIIAKRQPGKQAIFPAERFAQGTVHRFVLLIIPHLQLGLVCLYVAKHQHASAPK